MPKKIQRGDPSTALAKLYAIVGRLDLELDETIVPVVIVDDATHSPERRAAVGMVSQSGTESSPVYVALLHPEKNVSTAEQDTEVFVERIDLTARYAPTGAAGSIQLAIVEVSISEEADSATAWLAGGFLEQWRDMRSNDFYDSAGHLWKPRPSADLVKTTTPGFAAISGSRFARISMPIYLGPTSAGGPIYEGTYSLPVGITMRPRSALIASLSFPNTATVDESYELFATYYWTENQRRGFVR